MWELVLELGPQRDEPRFLQIARAISDAVQCGRLRPGARLPSTRALATQLGVHRKTVTAAYRELAGQGWIEIARARGAQITGDVPTVPRTRSVGGAAARAGFELPAAQLPVKPWSTRQPGQLLLFGGVPDLAAVPRLELARAVRGAITSRAGSRLLDYADPRGDHELRTALAEYLARTRDLAVTADSLAVVRGGQQAFYLIARTLLRPGDRVAVEALGYRAAWSAFKVAGLALEPVPVDDDGLDVAALEALCARKAIRAVYVTPHHQHPTTVTLTAARRIALHALARTHRLLIIEDDYDHEYRYDGRPVLPLAAADRHGHVCYVGTLSKVFAPGLRLGYVAASEDVIARIATYRNIVDQQGDHLIERAVAQLLTDGTLERHVRRARRQYLTRRDVLCEALHAQIPQLLITPPHGGMALWVRAPGIDVDAWVARAAANNVMFQPGSRFTFDGRRLAAARIGFGACNPRELVEAARRLAVALPRRSRR